MFRLRPICVLLIVQYVFYHGDNYAEAFSVIIVGAGPSGIAAATRLLSYGITDVSIFEAECRRGGRVHSVPFGDAFVDLGAQWCHGEKNNSVFQMVEKYDILKTSSEEIEFVYSNGQILDDDMSQKLFNFILNFDDHQTEEDKELSLGDYLIKEYDKTILEKYKDEKEKLKILVEAILTITSFHRSLEGAFDLQKVALVSHFEDCPGNQQLNWDGRGYATILDVMARTFPDETQKLPLKEHLFLNKPVTKIIYKWHHNKVRVLCDGMPYHADHIIFTPSLGVLKAKHRSLFEPELSEEKQTAINQLAFGSVLKIFLRFGEKWWNGDFKDTALIWSSEDRINLVTEFSHGPVDKNGESWLTSLYSIMSVERNPKVLTAWFTGPLVPEIELADEDVIKDGIIYALNKFFGARYTVYDPVEMIRGHWYTNEHFQGTYSYEPVGLNLSMDYHEALARPIIGQANKPLVLFAGEATHSTHYSTVNGAIDTGYREADRILRYYNLSGVY